MLDFFKSLFKPVPSSGRTAKERLRLVLLSDHLSLAPDVIESLKRDLLDVISRYVEIDLEHADVTFEQREREVAMLASIPITAVRDRQRPSAALPFDSEASNASDPEYAAEAEYAAEYATEAEHATEEVAAEVEPEPELTRADGEAPAAEAPAADENPPEEAEPEAQPALELAVTEPKPKPRVGANRSRRRRKKYAATVAAKRTSHGASLDEQASAQA
jgi:cell division topological specificity factor